EQPLGGDAAVDDDQQRRVVFVLRKRIEQPARERRLSRADVAHQDAEPLHLRAEVRQPDQRLRVLGRVEVETRDGRVREGLLGQLVVVEIVHQTKPILLLRAGPGGGSGSREPSGATGRDPAVAPGTPYAAALRGPAGAGCSFFLTRGRTVAARFPPNLSIRALTSRKPLSSAWIDSYCSSASALFPCASWSAPNSNC